MGHWFSCVDKYTEISDLVCYRAPVRPSALRACIMHMIIMAIAFFRFFRFNYILMNKFCASIYSLIYWNRERTSAIRLHFCSSRRALHVNSSTKLSSWKLYRLRSFYKLYNVQQNWKCRKKNVDHFRSLLYSIYHAF